MACPQNNVMTALLLANKGTRDIILPMLTDIQATKSLVGLHPEQGILLEAKEKKLEATVYSLFMNGEKKNIYKPVLMDKFIGAFTIRGQVEQAKLQKLLKQIDQGDLVGSEMEKTLQLLSDLGVGDLNIENVTKQLQESLIFDYVYKNKYKFKIDGERVDYKEYRDYRLKKGEVPKEVSNNSVYKSIQKFNGDEDGLESLNDFLIYNAVQEGDAKSAITMINKGIKGSFSAEEIAKASREELDSIIQSNIKNKELVNAVANRIAELDLNDAEDVTGNLLKEFAEKGSDYKATAEEIFNTMSRSLRSKLNFLNTEFGTNLQYEDFVTLLNKMDGFGDSKHIDNYIKKVISRKLGSEKYTGLDISSQPIKRLQTFFRNYYKSFAEVPQLGMVNANLSMDSKIYDLDNTVFVTINPKLTGKSKVAGDIFEDVKKTYTIPVGKVKILNVDDLASYLKTEEGSNIEHILVANKSAEDSTEIKKAIEGAEVRVSAPSKGNSIVFTSDSKGNLIIASDDYNSIQKVRQYGINNGSYSSPTIDEGRLGKSLDRWIDLTFPNRSVDEKNIAKSYVISGNEDAAALDFERNMRMATVVDRESQFSYVNIDEIREATTLQDILDYIPQFYKGTLPDGIVLDDVLKKLYINSRYALDSSTMYQEVAKGQLDLLKYLGIKEVSDLVDVAKNNDTAMDLMKGMYNDGYGTVVRWNGMDEFIDSIRNGAKLSDVSENPFFQSFVRANTNKDFELLTTEEGIFNKMQEYILNYKGIPNTKTQSGFGRYLVKDINQYGSMDQSLVETIAEAKQGKIKQPQKTVKQITKDILNSIDEYAEEFLGEIAKLKDGQQLDQSIQRRMKNKLFVSLREREIAIELFMKGEGNTHVFSIPSIYDNADVKYFQDQILDLKKRYDDEAIAINTNIESKADEGFDNFGKSIVADKDGELKTFTNEDVINDLIYSIPESVNINSVIPVGGIKSMTFEQQNDVIKVLQTIKSKLFRKEGLYNTIFEAIQPGMAKFIADYTNTSITIGENTVVLPKILTERNTSGTIFGTDQDLDIKNRIYKEISEIIKNGELKGEDIQKSATKIVSDFAEANNINEGVENLIDKYTDDFVGYLFIPKIDQATVNAGFNIANKEFTLTFNQQQILSQITYKDGNGTNKSISAALDVDQTKYPDILSRKETPLNINQVQGGTEVNKELTTRNVKLAIDEYDNGYKNVDKYHETAFYSVKNSANEILDTSPRLKLIKNASNQGLNSGQIASGELNPIFFHVKTAWSNFAKFVGLPSQYNADYMGKLIERYREYMTLGNKEFNEILSNKPSGIDASAYKIAQHYRLMKGLTKDLTVDKAVNKSIQSDFDNIFDNIVTLDNGKYSFVAGSSDRSGTRKLQGLMLSQKNGEMFYGLNTLSDLGIGYKKKTGSVFGFGNEFYDDGLEEFNRLFNSNIDLNQYRTVMGAMTGDVLSNPIFGWLKYINYLWNFANSPLSRLASTVPGSFVSGVPSSAGYINTIMSLRKINKNWGDFEGVTAFRQSSGILQSAAVDLSSVFSVNKIETWNPVESFVEGAKSPQFWNKYALRTMLGQGFDNGQNVIDGIFSETLKNQATIGAMKSEGFSSMDELYTMLRNSEITESYKRDIVGRISTKSYDMHEGMINYVGRGLSRNIDTGDFTSKLSGVISIITNPINFRSGLGNNAILNTISNVGKTIQYFSRYGIKDGSAFEALAKDPTLRQFMLSWVNDFAMALKLANLNDYGEDVNERQLNGDDIVAALTMASQNWQFINMSAAFRTVKDGISSDGNVAYNILNEYMRQSFRQLRVARMSLEALRVLSTGNQENFDAYLNKMFDEMSTGGLRYMIQDTQGKAIPVDTGLSTLFGGKNKYQEFFYDKPIGTAQFEQLTGESPDSNIGWTLIKDLMLSSQLGQITRIGTQVITNTIGLLNEKLGKTIADSLGIDYDTSYLPEGEAVTGFIQSEEYKKLQNGYYEFDKKNVYELGEDLPEYTNELNEIIRQMKLPYVVGSKDFADMIDAFRKTGKSAFETEKGYKVWEDESMTQVLKDMQDKGVLDDIYTQIKTTRNADETQRALSNYFVSYVDTMEDKPLNADLLQQKARLSYIYNDEVRNGKDKQKKELKKLLGLKKVSLNEADDLERNARFVEKYFNEIQYTASDGQRSWLGQDVAMNIYAKKHPEINEAFFDMKKGEDGSYEITGLKSKYETAIKQKIKFEEDLTKGITPNTVIQGIYGPYSMFAAKTSDGKFNKEANIEGILHGSKFIDSLSNMDKDDKDYLKIRLMSNMPQDALSIKDIEEKMGVDIADEYRQTLYQSYKDAVQISHAIMDDKSSKGGAGGKSTKISISGLSNQMKKMKDYMDSNSADMYKPISIDKGTIRPYAIPQKSRGESELRPPQVPAYSAKSKAIIPKPKKITSPELKPVKKKVLKVSKKKGAK